MQNTKFGVNLSFVSVVNSLFYLRTSVNSCQKAIRYCNLFWQLLGIISEPGVYADFM